MKWAETIVHPAAGPQQAIAPEVVSASRATDVPAFHAERFMRRLRAGFCLWVNPFNARQRQYVSFERCRAFVFWSKNPRPLMPHLDEIEAGGRTFYFQFTLNDYVREGLEPGVPSLAERIDTFQELSERLGRQRVIWRFDPVILGDGLPVEAVLDRIEALAGRLAPYTDKLVFSFLDMYNKTKANLKKVDASLRAPAPAEMQTFAEGLALRCRTVFPKRLVLATCAEELDLAALHIGHNRCIDPELLARLHPDLAERFGVNRVVQLPGSLTDLLKPLTTPETARPSAPPAKKPAKDAGQRRLCGCAPSKDIGSYNTCLHDCRYCYANTSDNAVRGTLARRDGGDERI